jgi:hypothetical protein
MSRRAGFAQPTASANLRMWAAKNVALCLRPVVKVRLHIGGTPSIQHERSDLGVRREERSARADADGVLSAVREYTHHGPEAHATKKAANERNQIRKYTMIQRAYQRYVSPPLMMYSL